jgi:hypothetical protein
MLNTTLSNGGARANTGRCGANSAHKNCGYQRRYARVLSVVVHACARPNPGSYAPLCTLGTDNAAAEAAVTAVKANHLLKGLSLYDSWRWCEYNQWPKWPKGPTPKTKTGC